MTRASEYELLIFGLREVFPSNAWMGYVTREDAYEELKELTDQDFGFDPDAWEEWLDSNVQHWRYATTPPSTLSKAQHLLWTKLRLLFKRVAV
jgi:hypothetical protein